MLAPLNRAMIRAARETQHPPVGSDDDIRVAVAGHVSDQRGVIVADRVRIVRERKRRYAGAIAGPRVKFAVDSVTSRKTPSAIFRVLTFLRIRCLSVTAAVQAGVFLDARLYVRARSRNQFRFSNFP